MNSKIVVGIIVGIAIIFGGVYAVSSTDSQTEPTQQDVEEIVEDEKPAGKVIDVRIDENFALGNQ